MQVPACWVHKGSRGRLGLWCPVVSRLGLLSGLPFTGWYRFLFLPRAFAPQISFLVDLSKGRVGGVIDYHSLNLTSGG